MKYNFYIKCLIRALKEYDVYEITKPRLYTQIYNKILSYDYVSTPHTIIDSVIEYLDDFKQRDIRCLYFKLIKNYYINNIVGLITEYYKDKCGLNKIIDTDVIWEQIETQSLLRHLDIKYKIKRSEIKQRKFEIFYRELYDKRPFNKDFSTHT